MATRPPRAALPLDGWPCVAPSRAARRRLRARRVAVRHALRHSLALRQLLAGWPGAGLHQGGEGFEDSAAAQVGGALSAAASGSPCGKPPESQQDAGRCKPTESQQDTVVEKYVESEQPVELEKHVQSEELEDAARAELAQLARAQAVATEVAERSIRRAEEHPEDFSAREAAKRAHAREREAAAALQRAIQRTQKLMAPRSSGASCRGHSRAKPRNLKPMQKKNGRHVPD
mmetsp:Transcript_78370/g.253868  ORF Transcript_78370/g.253868 Transcript_78370/m.253868 type:complete len:231 (+) Transcript_78370:85-777(+)